jgi:hypothetical protein
VLVDDTGVRALVTAHWLQQLGWDVSVLEDAFAGQRLEAGVAPRSLADIPASTEIAAEQAVDWLGRDGRIVTAGASAAYREAHAAGSIWANRATLDRLPLEILAAPRLLVVAEDVAQAHLLAFDLGQWSRADVRVLAGGQHAWIAAGLPVENSSNNPPDTDRIDFLFWNHDRHQGNPDAMRAYLQWEQDLPAQIAKDGTLDLAIAKPARPAERVASR